MEPERFMTGDLSIPLRSIDTQSSSTNWVKAPSYLATLLVSAVTHHLCSPLIARKRCSLIESICHQTKELSCKRRWSRKECSKQTSARKILRNTLSCDNR